MESSKCCPVLTVYASIFKPGIESSSQIYAFCYSNSHIRGLRISTGINHQKASTCIRVNDTK